MEKSPNMRRIVDTHRGNNLTGFTLNAEYTPQALGEFLQHQITGDRDIKVRRTGPQGEVEIFRSADKLKRLSHLSPERKQRLAIKYGEAIRGSEDIREVIVQTRDTDTPLPVTEVTLGKVDSYEANMIIAAQSLHPDRHITCESKLGKTTIIKTINPFIGLYEGDVDAQSEQVRYLEEADRITIRHGMPIDIDPEVA